MEMADQPLVNTQIIVQILQFLVFSHFDRRLSFFKIVLVLINQNLNPLNKKATADEISVSQLTSLVADQRPFKEVPDKKFYLAMDFNKIDNYHFHYIPYYRIVDVEKSKGLLYMPQINHISNSLPPSPPLSQLDDIPEVSLMKCNVIIETNCSD